MELDRWSSRRHGEVGRRRDCILRRRRDHERYSYVPIHRIHRIHRHVLVDSATDRTLFHFENFHARLGSPITFPPKRALRNGAARDGSGRSSRVQDFTHLRVLVTGVDGDSGQGLVKALRMSPRPMEIHGCDVSGGGIGGTFVDTLHLVPPASAGEPYVARLDRICSHYEVDAVVPSTPAEIDALCGRSSPPALPSGVPIVCLPEHYRNVYDDKLFCYQSLEGFVSLAPYADGTDAGAIKRLIGLHGFPLIVKRRRGRGGDSFQVVRKEADLAGALEKTADPVVQGFIDDEGGEYTVGLFAADKRVT